MNTTSSRALGALFALVVLLSAFLLFQVQPLLSKFILPWFGGGPAVWTTCVLFFQVALFVGYAYAHLISDAPRPLAAFLVHVALLIAAVALLPIAPDSSWRPTEGGDPTARILALLAFCVGLPYLALASTGPLVQHWFSLAFPGRSPYRLYALSNAGSLAALVTYPFLVEPALTVRRQATAWSWGFASFAALSGLAAWTTFRRGMSSDPQAPDNEAGPAPGPLTWTAWVALPSLGSIALLATTNHVCQDVAVVPFLWVVPLALYLLSFIVAFDHERWYLRVPFAGSVMVLAVALAGLDSWPVWVEYQYELLLHFLGLFALCMVCHGELVRLRPAPLHLTAFYLAIAAGGSLGGVFVGLIAPRAFTSYFEWPITLVLGYALAVVLLWRAGRTTAPRVVVTVVGVVGLLALAQGQGWTGRAEVHGRIGSNYNRGYECKLIEKTRSFFGVSTVLERRHMAEPELNDRVLFHGQIPHGLRLTAPGREREATTYYGPESGVGRAIAWASRDPNRAVRVGLIGLGVGTIASYARSGDEYRYYEIDPEVERLARAHFRFLDDCAGRVEVVLGDARNALEREPSRDFDVLALDAFSGDAIPMHLLTREALDVYRRHLAPDGVIAVHISNAYLDLAPVVRGLAADADMRTVRIWTGSDSTRSIFRADWMLMTTSEAFVKAHVADESDDPEPRRSVLWTDTRSNLFEVLR